jgi:bifunctional non-homologous end joining protein LigD
MRSHLSSPVSTNALSGKVTAKPGVYQQPGTPPKSSTLARKLHSSGATTRSAKRNSIEIPKDVNRAEIKAGKQKVELTNLHKLFWPALGLSKRDLLQYYADVAPVLLPHLRHRAMVMKRYPNGAQGEFFFMKRAPSPHPEAIQICPIKHASGNIIGFPVVEDLTSLLWIVNLGCIDLNPWYARCDDVDRPDYLHFDLDPTPEADFDRVREVALIVHEALEGLEIPSYPKTSGSRGVHVYVPIERGPVQKQVWTFAKALAQELAARYPKLITAQYRVGKRPQKHILVDYNQNAWGRTLASVYSVRPTERATVSTPVLWKELESGIKIEDFRIDNVPERVSRLKDIWKPLLAAKGRLRLERFL